MTHEESHFENLKKQSNYHFDPFVTEAPGNHFVVGGRLNNIWQQDLVSVIETLRPMKWSNFKKTFGRDGYNPKLKAQQNDILSGGGDPEMTLCDINDKLWDYPGFSKVINFFALEDTKARLHHQKTGQVFNVHIDTFNENWSSDISTDRMVRFTVMLEDWVPGQFYIYGNYCYSQWRAGDFHWFDWKNIPHGTANASRKARASLQISGLKTDRTEEILRSSFTEYSI